MGMFRVIVDRSEWTKNMQRAIKQGFPDAVADTLNGVALLARNRAILEARRTFTLRNKYTEGGFNIGKGGTGIWPAKGTKISSLNAVAGSKTPYMGLHESGGVHRAKNRSLAMPTGAGRGGDMRRAIPRGLTIRAMGQIRGAHQRYTRTGSKARRRGFFILGRGPSLRRPAIFRRTSAGLEKLRILGQRSQRVKATHFFSRAAKSTATYGTYNRIYATMLKRRMAARSIPVTQ